MRKPELGAQELHHVVPHPFHAGGGDLRYRHVAVAVHDEAGQRVALPEHHPVPGRVELAPAERIGRLEPFGEEAALEPHSGLAAHDAGRDEGVGIDVGARERLATVVPELDRLSRGKATQARPADVEFVVVDPGMPGAKAPLFAPLEIERCHGGGLYATLLRRGGGSPPRPAYLTNFRREGVKMPL